MLQQNSFNVRVAEITDGPEIMRVINDAYVIESGSSEFAFKKGDRLRTPFDDKMQFAYREGRIICVCDGDKGSIVGAACWEITEQNGLYFGPYAVHPTVQGRGVGKILLNELHRIAKERQLTQLEIKVVNHRTDLIPWYESMGYEFTGTTEWPTSHLDILTRPSHFLNMIKLI